MKIMKFTAMTCLSAFVVTSSVMPTITAASESQRQIGYGRGGRMHGALYQYMQMNLSSQSPLPLTTTGQRQS